MPAKLESSAAIDRGGSGETPDAGSSFRLVVAIPRGPARQDGKRGGDFFRYYGGSPLCPVCLKPNHVRFNSGWRFKHKYGVSADFHCLKCRVTWVDTDEVACYACGSVFMAERWPYAVFDSLSKFGGTCYHLNSITKPFCGRCTERIGDDWAHSRRQLRRMAGLR